MFASQPLGQARCCFLLLVVATALVASGCVTTTTAIVEANMHSDDSVYRFQSCDMTARVQVEFKRN